MLCFFLMSRRPPRSTHTVTLFPYPTLFRALGLIAGTSADGIDAALVSFAPNLQVHAAHTVAYAPLLREQILQLSQASARVAPDDLARLDTAIGRAFAEAAEQVIEVAAIDRERIDRKRVG